MGVHLHFRIRWTVIVVAAIVVFGAVLPFLLEMMLGREVSYNFSEAFHTLRTTESFVFTAVGFSVLVYVTLLSLAVAGITIYASHHIAHPLHHLEQSAEAMGRGDLRYAFHLRHWDQLQGLAGELDEIRNASIDQLRQVGESLDRIEEGWLQLDKCRPEEYDAQAEKQLALVETELERVRKLLSP